jgi:multiple antibiotic resistance protein
MMKLMGAKFEGALTRLLGVVLAALAAQFVVDGIKQSFSL